MKKKVLTRVFALIGAVIAVVTMTFVPTFAYEQVEDFKVQQYTKYSGEEMEGVSYSLRTHSSYEGCFDEFDYDITYQVPQTCDNYIYVRVDTYPNPDGSDPYVDVRCKKLRIYSEWGFGYTAERYFALYLDDVKFLVLHYVYKPDSGDERGSLSIECLDPDITITGEFTDPDPFNLTIGLCESWLVSFQKEYYTDVDKKSDCWMNAFARYDVTNYKDNETQNENGYANGYKEGKTEGYDIGWNEGYGWGYEYGIEEGYQVGYPDGQAYGESLHAEDWQYGYDIGYLKGTNDGVDLGYELSSDYYDDYWSNFYQSSNYVYAVEKSIKSNDSNPVTAFFNSMWNGLINAYDTVTQNISVGGVSLAMVITTIILAVVVIWLVRVLRP